MSTLPEAEEQPSAHNADASREGNRCTPVIENTDSREVVLALKILSMCLHCTCESMQWILQHLLQWHLQNAFTFPHISSFKCLSKFFIFSIQVQKLLKNIFNPTNFSKLVCFELFEILNMFALSEFGCVGAKLYLKNEPTQQHAKQFL